MSQQIQFRDGESMQDYLGVLWPLDSSDRVACVLKAYFDESWDQHQQKILVIGGMFGRWGEWSKVEWRWKELLDEYEIQYYRASEAEFARGQFDKEPFRTKDLPTTQEQFKLLHEVRERFFGVTVSGYVFGLAYGMPLALFKEVANTPEKLDKFGDTPYYYCGYRIMDRLLSSLKHEVGCKELVALIFDQQEEYEAEMRRLHSHMCLPDYHCRSQVGTMTFADKTKFLPLQVADTLAFEARKDFERKLADPDAVERPEFTRLKAEHKIIEFSLCTREGLEEYLKATGIQL
jgi:hypothetical protein